MRSLAETVFIARARVDLNHLERVPEALLERRESIARRHPVLTESQAHGAQTVIGSAIGDGAQLHSLSPVSLRRVRPSGNGTDG